MKAFSDAQLYAFVDTAYLHGRAPAVLARQLCDGGADIIQLRAKKETRDEMLRMAEAILPICRAARVPLVINDFGDVAQQVGAECLHLGQEDFFDAGFTHRAQLPTQPGQLGLSSHSPEQAQRAVEAGAAYIAIGPLFATGTKPGRSPVTLELARWAATQVSIPWFAIGGITLDNVDQVIDAGARRICVVSAILNASDIAETCRAFKKRLIG